MLPSALVMTNGSPTGRHPWDTSAVTSTPVPRTAPTAPSVTTWSSTTRRLPPGATAADASPPTIGSPGRSSARRWRMSSAGKVKGSASSRMADALSISDAVSASGHPTTALPAGVDAAVGLDGAVVLVGEFAADQGVPELAGLDLQGLSVARHLLAAGVPERCLEGALAAVIGGAADEHDEVRRERHGDGLRGSE